MRYQKKLAWSATCFLLAFLCTMIWLGTCKENLAQRISPEILRFHILANSNSHKDQEIKSTVRDMVITYLSQEKADSKAALCRSIADQKEALTEAVNACLASMGCTYQSQAELTSCYFPTKAYGDIVLPCGTYDALKITLGAGRGRNWWCVLYPRLCFINATHAVIPDSSKEELRGLLEPEDYEKLLDHRELTLKVRFLLPVNLPKS